MKGIFLLISLSIILASCSNAARVDVLDLLSKMSIEDKCGQMTQITFDAIEKLPAPTDPDENPVDLAKLLIAVRDKKVGSILNTPYNLAQKASTWQKIIRSIQDVALNNTSLKIPILYGIDSIHGANYIRESVLFPQPLAMAASFNVDIAHRVGEITALETRATGIPWNFNPVLDVGRQPLWPRLWETYGEDVHLTIRMGEEYIRGHQGKDLKDRKHTATCLKHFIGYSYPANGRDRSVAQIPEILLRETFLPPFEAGVLAGSPTVMINSGEVNGLPGHANGYFINDILKGELKFSGFTVSDWEDIIRLYTRDGLAESPEDAVRIAVMAGLDMSMVPFDYSFYDHCVNLARKDRKFLDRVDDATKRILKVKLDLGLFENSYPDPDDLKNINTSRSNDFNLEAASESIVLAKNENKLLPLDRNSPFKILVVGASGNSLRVLNGGWSYSWKGDNEQNFVNFASSSKTIFESIKNFQSLAKFSEGANFTHVTNLEETIASAKESDQIILCIGEDTYIETEGNINNLALPESQAKLANAILELQKPTIVVYLGGRPRLMTEIAEKAHALLIAFLPGNRGGEAIANILFGKVNPSARLPITFPKYPNGITTYDHKPIEAFGGNKYENLFPFGHGLSYTEFEYSNIEIDTKYFEYTNSFEVTAKVQVKNVGDTIGQEVVILYLQDIVGSVSRPKRQVKAFTKVSLSSGQSREVKFTLYNKDLSFIGAQNKRIVEPGVFNVYIGNQQANFTYKNVVIPDEENSSVQINLSWILALFCMIYSLMF